MKAKRDIYQECTDQVIEALESNPGKWESGLSGLVSDLPIRSTGEYYKGINVILLSLAGEKGGYTSNQWITYKQAQDIGGCVRKGEHGTGIVFFKTLEVDDRAKQGKKITIPMLRSYSVFNLDQIDGLPDKYQAIATELFEWDSLAAGEMLYKSSACDIRELNQVPHYAPELDYIGMPAKAQFDSAGNYYSTLAHEMAHSTGHKSRLFRDSFGGGERTKKTYAFEEMIAELSAVYTCKHLGIDGNLENHASYIQSWLKCMKDDKRFIFQAAAKAQKATDFILARVDKAQEQLAA